MGLGTFRGTRVPASRIVTRPPSAEVEKGGVASLRGGMGMGLLVLVRE